MNTGATIWTIGHSNRTFDELVEKLKENAIEVLVDVRTFPRSRFRPWFNESYLLRELPQAGIRYVYKGKNLGGRGENVAYEETIDELVALAESGTRICVMCSEGKYTECHRYTMLTPSFEERELSLEHITW